MRATRNLGGGLSVSAMGLGCMGMSGTYGPTNWDSSIDTIHRALDLGVTLLDTADIYGAGHNEVLVGRAIHGRRGEVQLATKCGIDRSAGRNRQTARGDADYIRACCDASLTRLGVETIDLYYLHRPPQNVEIEEAIGAMAELVKAGKIHHLGVSEFNPAQLRRACAVHPIAAMQSEYSLWTRDVEDAATTLSELDVGLVVFSPLGRGFLTGTVDRTALGSGDFRSRNARFTGDAGDANEAIVQTVRQVASDLDALPAQVALAWVYAQADRLGVPIVAIPGTTHPERVGENLAALDLHLEQDTLGHLDPLGDLARGDRYGMS